MKHYGPFPEREAFNCVKCNLSFPNISQFRNHNADFHKESLPFVCTVCGRGYTTSMGLSYHMNTHEGKSYLCPVCSAPFTRSFAMKRHLRNAHQAVYCQTCNALIEGQEAFQQHIRLCRK